MATNPPGRGTVNAAVNLLIEERKMLISIAIAEDRSLSDTIRRFTVEGVRARHPEIATQIDAARRARRNQQFGRGGARS